MSLERFLVIVISIADGFRVVFLVVTDTGYLGQQLDQIFHAEYGVYSAITISFGYGASKRNAPFSGSV